MEKFLTFITPTKDINRNQFKYLANDINELQKLISPKSIEWLIIDHKSKKEDLDFISRFKEKVSFDIRIYDFKEKYVPPAYNYGFEKSIGIWNIFIGHDDRILVNNFYSNIQLIERNQDKHIISFPSIRVFNNKKVNLYPSKFLLIFKNTIPHPSTLINKKVKKIYGPYIYPSYIMTADYSFFLSAFLNKKIKFKLIKKFSPLVLHSAYGVSKDKDLCVKEIIEIQKRILGFSPYLIIKCIRSLRWKLFSYLKFFN